MYAFTYDRPASLAEAAKLVQAGGQALAGGQTMLASMKQRLMQPEKLVDLSRVSELSGVRKEGDQLVVGAMTKHCDVEQNALVKQHIPALAALAGGIGDRQVRAMGTLGEADSVEHFDFEHMVVRPRLALRRRVRRSCTSSGGMGAPELMATVIWRRASTASNGAGSVNWPSKRRYARASISCAGVGRRVIRAPG
mgnify:CR=1 FL=1